jgi:cyanophycinase
MVVEHREQGGVMNKRVMVLAFIAVGGIAQAGSLVVIGGNLDPENKAIYQRMIDLTGKDGRICVFGTASANPARSAGFIVDDFKGFGGSAVAVDITTKNAETATSDAKVLEAINGCKGFFFVGGDQRRITEAFMFKKQETAALKALRARFQAGAMVAGTSAGAAVISDPMISGGSSIDTLAGGKDRVTLEPGLGLVKNVVTDQHFLKRGRFGRLISVLAQTNLRLGVGVDEDTAVVIPEKGPWEIVGTSSAVIVEMPDGSRPDNLKNIELSMLSQGDTFDPVTREIKINPKRELIKAGDEFLEAGLLFTSDVFAPDAMPNLVADLVDSPEKSAVGVSFLGSSNASFTADGVRATFVKTARTKGYYGTGAGFVYSVERISVSFEAVRVTVAPR